MVKKKGGKGMSKSHPRYVLAAKRRQDALELRLRGCTFKQIAEKVGYRSEAGAYKSVMSALRKANTENVEEVRKMEVRRLDRMLFVLDKKLREADTKAIQVALRIQERRARLLGLDLQVVPTMDVRIEQAAIMQQTIVNDPIAMQYVLAVQNRALGLDDDIPILDGETVEHDDPDK